MCECNCCTLLGCMQTNYQIRWTQANQLTDQLTVINRRRGELPGGLRQALVLKFQCVPGLDISFQLTYLLDIAVSDQVLSWRWVINLIWHNWQNRKQLCVRSNIMKSGRREWLKSRSMRRVGRVRSPRSWRAGIYRHNAATSVCSIRRYAPLIRCNGGFRWFVACLCGRCNVYGTMSARQRESQRLPWQTTSDRWWFTDTAVRGTSVVRGLFVI